MPAQTNRTNEERLIQEFLQGNPAAVEHLDGWIDGAVRARLPLSARADRADLKQEVRARLIHRLGQGRFDHRASLRTFIDRIARNAAVDLLRASARRRDIASALRVEGARPAARLTPEARLSQLDLPALLAGQSSAVRRTLEMVLLHEIPYAEAARRLGVPEGTVKSRVARFRGRLARAGAPRP
jgi:RNA polymerase sigma-70 factor (ECF subfamily)